MNLVTGTWSNIYEKDKYYPSSLGKIPILIAYLQLSESDGSTMSKTLTYPFGSEDTNLRQDIKPEKNIQPGKAYTIEDLLEYMIRYSDNNAAVLLANKINLNSLKKVYADLEIPLEDTSVNISNLDYISPQQISTLFRVLYNATYLSRENSEKALKLMSETSFNEGIASGVPAETTVSHKMGVVGIGPALEKTNEHELHDCGIIYVERPYALCVMSRGTGKISQMEVLLKDISKAVYSIEALTP